MAVFDFFNIRTLLFKYIYLKFCTHIHRTKFFHIYSSSKKFNNFLWGFLDVIIYQLFSQIFRIFEILKIHETERAVNSQHCVENQLVPSFNLFACQRFTQTFLPAWNRENMALLWRHVWLTYHRLLSECTKFVVICFG